METIVAFCPGVHPWLDDTVELKTETLLSWQLGGTTYIECKYARSFLH